MKRKINGRKAAQDLKRIEDLLQSTKQHKPELIGKVKTIQHSKKESPVDYLKCSHQRVKVVDVQLTDHSYERAIDRFSLKHTKKEDVLKYLQKHLSDAEYIGQVTSADGNDSEMFVKGQFCFHLNTELDKIITVVKIENKIKCNPVQDKMNNLVHKEFRKLDRTEKARLRKLHDYRYDVEIEIAEANRRIYRTRSESVKLACQARIKALELELEQLQLEIEQLRTSKRQVAYLLASSI